MNPFPYSFDNKRYHTYNYFLKTRYHKKIAKVALNADFTCPNRDGTKGTGGCLFCSTAGSGDFAGNIRDSLLTQFDKQAAIMHHKWPDASFIAYFQAFTNTYAPLPILKARYAPFIHHKDIVGIAIATRADCVDEEIASYLEELDQEIDVYVELGLQTIHDETSASLNRQETFSSFKEGLSLLRKHHLSVCVHLINGLPNEDMAMMLESARAVGQLDIQGLKIHNLFLLKDTPLARIYDKHPFPMLSREDYIQLAVRQLEYIPPEVVIERLTGDAPRDDLIAPLWSLKKTTILNDIDKLMARENITQGDLL